MMAEKFTAEDVPSMAEAGMYDNLFGTLKPEIVDRLKQLLADPKRYWDRDNGIILRMGKTGEGFGLGFTVWQAWIATDPAAPHTGPATTFNKTTGKSRRGKWPKTPTRAQLLKALEYAAFTPRGPMWTAKR